MTYKFQMHRYEDELKHHDIKLDRLSTFNRELRSKVDYFITLLQSLNLNNPIPTLYSAT